MWYSEEDYCSYFDHIREHPKKKNLRVFRFELYNLLLFDNIINQYLWYNSISKITYKIRENEIIANMIISEVPKITHIDIIPRATWNIFDLKDTIKVLSEYEGYAVYDEALGAFGSINYHVLKAIFLKVNDRQTLTELESLIFDIGAFIMGGPAPDHVSFNPDSNDLKYPLNDNDNPSTELLKTLYNIVYENIDKISKHHPINYEENGEISPESLASLFGLSDKVIENYILRFEATKNNPATFKVQDNIYLKLKVTLDKALSSPELNDVQTLVENALDKFSIKKWGKFPFTLELREIFSKYASPISGQSGDVFSEPKLSEALHRGHNYIQKLKQPGTTQKENMDKYFRVITLIDLINDKKVRPYGKDSKEKLESIEKIKDECIDLLFRKMVDKKMIHSEDMRSLFDTVTITLTTLTIATKPRVASNRQAVYTFTDLTRITSKKDPDKTYAKTKKELCFTRNLGLVFYRKNEGVATSVCPKDEESVN